MGIWLPQVLQKRLVLRILQQISILSNLDLSNLNISIGTNSKFSFNDINLYVNEIDIPNFDIVLGKLDQLDINLSVSSDLDIDGSGLTFILKTLDDSFDINFSLTKSIHDLANSFLQFTPDELFKGDDITTEENRKYMDDLLNESSSDDGSINSNVDDNESLKANSNDRSNDKYNDRINNAKSLTKLQLMKNKVLNSLLKKLNITLRNLKICIQNKDGMSKYIVHLEKILITVMEDNTRQILINGSEITTLKPNETNKFGNSYDNMAKSMYYSKLDDTSIYMSALESSAEIRTPVRNDSIVENNNEKINNIANSENDSEKLNEASKDSDVEDFTELTLFEMDSLQITFDGIINVDQFKISNLTVDIETITLNTYHIIGLNDNVLKYLLNLLNLKLNPIVDSDDSDYETQSSQVNPKLDPNILSFIFLKCLKINLFPEDAILLEHIYLNYMENDEIKLNINHLKSEGEFLQLKTDKKPILKGTITQNMVLLELISQIDMKITENKITNLHKLVKDVNEFIDFIRNALLKNKNNSHNKAIHSNGPSRILKVIADSVSLTCTLQNYNISLLIDPIVYDGNIGTLITQKIKLLRTNNDALNQLLILNNVRTHFFGTQQKYSSFDNLLENTTIYTQLVVDVESINYNETYSKLKILLVDLNNIFHKFTNQETNPQEKNKLECMKRSVRILASSRIFTKNNSIASAIIKIGLLKCSLKQALKTTSFGILKSKLKDCSVIFSAIDGSISFFVNTFELNRVSKQKKINESLIRTLKFGSQIKPCIYLEYSSSETENRINLKLNGLELKYRAKWLKFLRELRSTHHQEDSTLDEEIKSETSAPFKEKSNFKINVSLIKFSLMFFPYRINPAMVMYIDNLNTIAFNLSPFSVQSILQNCTLFLIDDSTKITTRNTENSHSFKNHFMNQGFCSIGTLKSWKVGVNKDNAAIKLNFDIDNASLLLCADSFYTLIQLCIDLKYPETFPEDMRTQTMFDKDIDVFKNVDLTFFDKKITVDSVDSKIDKSNSFLNIEESFLDKANICGKEETIILNEQGVNSDIIQENATFNIQENYIDSMSSSPNVVSNERELDNENISISVSLTIYDTVIKLFDGYDWKYSRKLLADEIDKLQKNEIKNQEENYDIDDCGREENTEISVFNSIYITSNSSKNLNQEINRDLQDDNSQDNSNGLNLHPSLNHKVLIHLTRTHVDFLNYNVDYPTIEESDHSADTLNEIAFSINTFEIIDNVSTSTWNKFASILRQEKWNVKNPMFELILSMIRPLDYLPAIEYIMKLNVAPLRFHIDQDTLDYLIRFFTFKDLRFALIDDYPDTFFLEKISISKVKLMIDYKPKKIDYLALKSGHASELMNFFIIDGSTVVLKEILLYGVNGFAELGEKLKTVWAPDIAKRQLGGVLEGITPLKTFISLGSGVKTLVTVLMSDNQNKKKQIRGNFKSKSDIFLRISTGEFIKLGVKLTIGTQHILERTEKILGGQGPKIRNSSYNDLINMDNIINEDQLIGNNNTRINGKEPSALVIDTMDNRDGKPKLISLYADQPLDIHQGLEEAYHSLEKHMQVAYDTVWRQNKSNDLETPSAAAISVAKVTPIAIIRPLIGATEAISKTLQGLANQIDKEHLDEVNDKYKSMK